MVKYDKFTAETDGTMGISFGLHTWGKYDSKYWYSSAQVDTPNYDQNIESITAYNGSVTVEHSEAISPDQTPDAYISPKHCLAIYGDDILSLISFKYPYNSGASTRREIHSVYSTNGGSTWNTYQILGEDVDRIMQMFQCVKIGSDLFGIWLDDLGSTGTLHFVDLTDGTDVSLSLGDDQGFYKGCIDEDGNYRFAYVDSSDNWKIATFNGTSVSDIETLTATEPTAYLTSPQEYYRRNDVEILYDVYYIRIRVNGGDWKEVASTSDPDTDIRVIWGDEYELKYLFYDGIIYYLQKAVLCKLDTYTTSSFNGYAGMDYFVRYNSSFNYYVNNKPTLSSSVAEVVGEIGKPYKAVAEIYTQPLTNQWLHLYDDDETDIGLYRIESYTSDGSIYVLNLRGADEFDLEIEIDSSHSSKDAPDILSEVVAGCIFFTEGTISNTPSTTYSVEFTNKKISEKFKWIGQTEGYIVSWTPEYEIYYDQYSDSGISITDSDIVDLPIEQYASIKPSRFVIYGGFVDGERLVSEIIQDITGGTYYDWFSEIRDQTELDNIAAQIAGDQNIELGKFKLVVDGKGFIRPGTYIDLTLSEYSISNEDWYVVSSKYNALTDVCALVVVDAQYVPQTPQRNNMGTQIQNNKQNIANVAQNGDLKQININNTFKVGSDGKMDSDLDMNGNDIEEVGHIVFFEASLDPFIRLMCGNTYASPTTDFVIRLDNSEGDQFQIRDNGNDKTYISIVPNADEVDLSQNINMNGNNIDNVGGEITINGDASTGNALVILNATTTSDYPIVSFEYGGTSYYQIGLRANSNAFTIRDMDNSKNKVVVGNSEIDLYEDLNMNGYNVSNIGNKTIPFRLSPYGANASFGPWGGIVLASGTGSRVGFNAKIPSDFDVTKACSLKIQFTCESGNWSSFNWLLRLYAIGENEDYGDISYTIDDSSFTMEAGNEDEHRIVSKSISANTFTLGDLCKGYLYQNNSAGVEIRVFAAWLEHD